MKRRGATAHARPRLGAGIPVLAVALFFVLFFPYYAVQWFALAIALVIVVSYLYAVVITRGLTVVRAPMDLITYRYQSATVSIRIANRSPLPMPHLLVSDSPGTLYAGYENALLLSLRPREPRVLEYQIKGMNRGSYRIGPINVRLTDPLGLFPVAAVFPEEIRLIVYPTIFPVHVGMDAGLPAGTVTAASRIYEDPTRYRSVREYSPGDEMKRINWKVSARTGRLHSTEWLPTLNFPVMILLNLTATDYERSQRYLHTERTIDAAASLVHHLAEKGQAVGLASSGLLEADDRMVRPWIPTGSGAQHAVSILQTLAQLHTDESPDAPDAVSFFLENGSVSFGTRVFYMGPPLAEEQVAALLSSVGARSMVRLYYTDERVTNWSMLAVETVRLYRITEFGDELLVAQT